MPANRPTGRGRGWATGPLRSPAVVVTQSPPARCGAVPVGAADGSPFAQAAYRLREGIPTGAVVREHVHGRASRGEQHGVSWLSELRGRSDHTVHDRSVVAGHVDDADIGRVSRKGPGDRPPVPSQEYDAPQPVTD